MTLKLKPKAIFKTLTLIICGLVVLSIAGQFSTYYLGHGRLYGFVNEFYMDEEKNLTAFFSCLLLISCSLLLGVNYKASTHFGERFSVNWALLSIIFLYMAMDEAFQYHEKLIEPVREGLGVGGIFYFAWIIPFMAILILLFIFNIKFLIHLPRPISRLFIFSGLLYTGGAIGVEMIGGYYAESFGTRNFTYSLITTVEESMEMMGLNLFIYSLLRYFYSYVNTRLVLEVKTS